MLTIGSLFSGIGGLELGLEWAGLGPVLWQVEKDPFCRAVLAKHWPEVKRFEDVCAVGAAELAPVDLICGGFPCQDISYAGKGAGLAGERSGLWFQFARIIREVGPRYVVVENVAALLNRGMAAVLGSLASLGFDCWWDCIPAGSVGAPHIRDRVFLVAYSTEGNAEQYQDGKGQQQGKNSPGFRGGLRLEPFGHGTSTRWNDLGSSCPGVRRVADGNASRVDSARVGALGNAVVPQCAEVVGWVIRELAGLTDEGLARSVGSRSAGGGE